MRYLQGGPPEPGARDSTPPAQSSWAQVPYRLTFGLESQRWNGGGVAFLDTARTDLPTIVRAWDITVEQFEDVCMQENRGTVGTSLNWHALANGPLDLAGSAWYRHVLPVAVADLPNEQPALTFTSPEPVPQNSPDELYLDTIRIGLADHPTLTASDIETYLQPRAQA